MRRRKAPLHRPRLALEVERPGVSCATAAGPLKNQRVWIRLVTALAVGLLSAVAIDQGFGVGFVNDAVAYPTVAYSCVLVALVTRSQDERRRSLLLNLLSHASVGVLLLLTLRSVLQIELPLARFATTGHFPYVALPAATVAAQLVWELLPIRVASKGQAHDEPGA